MNEYNSFSFYEIRKIVKDTYYTLFVCDKDEDGEWQVSLTLTEKKSRLNVSLIDCSGLPSVKVKKKDWTFDGVSSLKEFDEIMGRECSVIAKEHIKNHFKKGKEND